jgi:3-oxoacid CoA-transferase
LTLTELAPGVEIEEIQKKTDAKFKVADEVRSME